MNTVLVLLRVLATRAFVLVCIRYFKFACERLASILAVLSKIGLFITARSCQRSKVRGYNHRYNPQSI